MLTSFALSLEKNDTDAWRKGSRNDFTNMACMKSDSIKLVLKNVSIFISDVGVNIRKGRENQMCKCLPAVKEKVE